MDVLDDDDDDFPLSVRAAGALWAAAGVVLLLESLAVLALLVLSSGANRPSLVEVAGAMVVTPFALVLVFGGVATVRGGAIDVLPGAAASSAVGTLALALPLVFPLNLKPIGFVLLGIPATLLATAGLLALTGRTVYVRWRLARQADRLADLGDHGWGDSEPGR
jgi:hypothetical protein